MIPTGLPAELIPQMFMPCLTTGVIIPVLCRIVNSFSGFSAKKIPAGGNGLPGGKNDCEKTYALALCRSKICGATRIRITTRTVVRMASGSM